MGAHARELRDLLLIRAGVDAPPDVAQLAGVLGARWRLRNVDTPKSLARILAASAGQRFVVLLDLRGARDLSTLARFNALFADTRLGWVAAVASDQLQHDDVRDAIRAYCCDYVTLPCPDRVLRTVVGHAYGLAALVRLGPGLERPPTAGMIGESAPMKALYRVIRKAAASDAPVLVGGETGTGKELTARAIHDQSRRREHPFVAINCGAIPQHLLQSELFGYERGAFTGAQQRKIGRIELAHSGTLFLDEIGDLPLDSQAALLRFLQEGQIERLGGHASIRVDARIISATHVDLEARVAAGGFRLDLYHRLCVLNLRQPPLRERGSDIQRIAVHALQRLSAQHGRALRGFTPAARRALQAYPWPGNVRELLNRVHQAVVMAEGRCVTAEDLRIGAARTDAPATLEAARRTATRHAVAAALARNGGHITEAARELAVSRVTLYRLMGQLDLQPRVPA